MDRSSTLFNEAKNYIPGGVNSPVRAFKGVGGEPIYFERGEGAYLYDVDGNAYIDYVGSWGPMILGHSNPFIVDAVRTELDNGLGFGAPTEIETSLAKKICQLMPSIELVRMVSSGTEATMSAIRLARGYTKRDKIVKFEGCYHGHSDSLLVKAGDEIKKGASGEMMLTIDHLERCLVLYPMSRWEEAEKKILSMPNQTKKVRNMKRFIIGHASEVSMDGQGRIMLAALLRDYARMDKKMVLVGQADTFELWDADAWNKNYELGTELEPLDMEDDEDLSGFSI